MPMTKPISAEREFYLRERRTERGVTQEELAAHVGTSKGMISQLETGYQRYHEDWIRKLSDALEIPQVALFLPVWIGIKPGAEDKALASIVEAWPLLTSGQRETVAKMVAFVTKQ